MKKLVVVLVVAAVFVVALGTAGFVYAQTPTPQGSANGTGNGFGMMNGRGGRGGMMSGQNAVAGNQDGLLHDEMIAAYAQKLGISVDELNTRLAKGETMAQIATSKGLTADQFRTLMADARSLAIEQAVKNGTLTQEQADWMNQRGAGMANGGRGMRGNGLGRNSNLDCPMFPDSDD